MARITIDQGTTSWRATADPDKSADERWAWAWRPHGDQSDGHIIEDQTTATLTDIVQHDGEEVQARLLLDGDADNSTIAAASEWTKVDASALGGSRSDERASLPAWPASFAIAAGVAAIIVSGLLAWAARVWTRLRETNNDPTTLEALPGQMAWPLLTLGWVVLAVGLWMVAVEWRATFIQERRSGSVRKSATDPAKVLEALGKLKGATLVTLVGLVLLLAPAWIAGSAAGSEGTGGDDSAVTTSVEQ